MPDFFAINPQPVDQAHIYNGIFEGTSYAPTAQSFNEADFYQLFAGASAASINNSPPEIAQDTWDDLMVETGVYPQMEQSANANLTDAFSWTLPSLFSTM